MDRAKHWKGLVFEVQLDPDPAGDMGLAPTLGTAPFARAAVLFVQNAEEMMRRVAELLLVEQVAVVTIERFQDPDGPARQSPIAARLPWPCWPI